MARIGIFSGSFDPVHKGHITFAMKAAESADLDKVFFLPEIRPRNKNHVTHISHRLAMLQLAARPHNKLDILDLPDKQFWVSRTWPRLKQRFPNDKLFLLMGSDTFENINNWPHANLLFEEAGVVVATRGQRDVAHVLNNVVGLNRALWEVHIVESHEPNVSSRIIRSAIAKGERPDMVVTSVERYIRQNWLYVSVSSISAS